MDLKAYIAILWGNKWVILATMFVTVAITAASIYYTTPIYSASTTIRVATASGGSASYSDYMYADRLMNTYVKIAMSRPVLNELKEKLGLQTAPSLKVETIPNTELIKITVESPSPSVAQSAANTLADIMITQSKELYSGGGKSTLEILGEQLAQAESEVNQSRQDYEKLVTQNPGDSERIAATNQEIQLKENTYASLLDQYDQARLKEAIRANIISIVEPAVIPLAPSKPRKAMNIGLGFMVGLAGGVGLAFLFETLNSRLYTSNQIIIAADLPPIGKIPTMRSQGLLGLKNSGTKNGNAPYKEAFHLMRTKILARNQDNSRESSIKTLMITSAEPGEGKSTIVTNFAISVAQAGQKVIVVDADMRLPRIHKTFNLSNKLGLSSVLSQQAQLKKAVQESRYSELKVLTSGPIPSNPTELLESGAMRALIDQLAQEYDMVLVDTPALLAVADGAVIAPMMDGVALVARRTFIRAEAVQEACRQLADVKARVIGVVVNEAEQNGTYYYYRRR